MSADVVSFAERAAQLAPLGGEVVEVRGEAGADFTAAPPPELKFAEGDDVSIVYRAYEGRPEIRSVLYGPTLRRVAWGLCRELGRTGDQIIAKPAGNPQPWDLAWIEIAPGQPNAGDRLARIRGVTHTQLNIALGRPVVRLEHSHTSGRAVPLFDPDGLAFGAGQITAQPDMGDDE
ncbi:hypothetical protein [Caulobacter sp. BP25]|uniref:hypothetical protein n=1 Tax=Caulobacter sp. BP25 TaxID=2048900 RepID=UPI000C12CEE2|nr:hypothetical protein [Caulobacter sp. BP25]PHY20903.1 hypothetical protein CSW59_06745 [Caulobacter sp. BP25]